MDYDAIALPEACYADFCLLPVCIMSIPSVISHKDDVYLMYHTRRLAQAMSPSLRKSPKFKKSSKLVG